MKTRTKAVPNSRYKTVDKNSTKGAPKSKTPASSSASGEPIAQKRRGRAQTKNQASRKQILVEKKNSEPKVEDDFWESDSMEHDSINSSASASARQSYSEDTNKKNSTISKFRRDCAICSKSFADIALFKRHMKTRHPKKPIQTPKPYACKKCDAKFKYSDRLAEHISQNHPKNALGARDITSVHEYFGSLATNESSRIMCEIQTVFKHTNKFVSCLNTEAGLEHVSNYDQLLRTHRSLLEKQLEIFEAASSIISGQRDSLNFAFEGWIQKHSSEPVEVEDYSSLPMGIGLNLELSSDGTIVTDKKCLSDPPVSNTETKASVELRDIECQTTVQWSDLQLSDCLMGDEEFEFLDSKTGMYITNKSVVEVAPETEPKPQYTDVPIFDNDEEMVELIEVDEDFEDADTSTLDILSISEKPSALKSSTVEGISLAPATKVYQPVRPEQASDDTNSTANSSPLPSQIRNALLDVEPNAQGFYKCIKCSFISSASSRLIPHYKQTHLKSNNSKPCKHCDRLLIDDADLRKHMAFVHSTISSNNIGLKCKHQQCSMILFQTRQDLDMHMSRKHPANTSRKE